jgi:sugar phosphate permease
VTSLPFLLTVPFLFGAGEAGCFPNITKAFCVWLPKGERTRAQGIMWLSARWGGAFTPSIVAVMITYVGWRHSFEIFGSLGLIWALFFYRWFRDNPLDNPKLNHAERDLLKENAGMGHGHSNLPWGRLVTTPSVLLLCAQYFCLSYGWYFYITWLPTYLREARHLTLAKSAILGGLPLFMGGLGNPVAVFCTKYLVRQNGDLGKTRRIMAYIGFAGASAFVALSTTMNSAVLAVCCMAAASFFNDLTMPGTWATCIDVGGRYAGTVSGTMNMCGNLGGALCPVAIGFILSLSHNNWNLAFYLSAAVYFMGIFCWMYLDPVTPFVPTLPAAEPGECVSPDF